MIVIDLEVSNKKTDSALNKLDKALEKLDRVQQALNSTLQQTAAAANQAAGAFGRMAVNGRRAQASMPGNSPGARRVSAYYSAIAGTNPQAALNYANNQLRLDPYNAQAIRLQNRAQNALKRQQNAANPMHGLQTAMARTRWAQTAAGMVGMPLGVDLAKYGSLLLGSGMVPGGAGATGAGLGGAASSAASALSGLAVAVPPLAVAIGTVVAAVQGFKGLTRLASDSSQYGSPTDILKLKALGLDASFAGRLQSGIQGGIGAGFAAQAGINPMGGPFGDNDYAKKATKAINAIANQPTFDKARRMAEGLGVPDAAKFFYLNRGNREFLSQQMRGPSQNEIGAAVNFEATGSRVSAAIERIKLRLLPVLATVAVGMEGLAWVVDRVSDAFNMFIDWLMKLLHIKRDGNDTQRANIKALEDNTRALNGMRETFGGGPRAQGSIPSKIRGLNSEAMNQIRLGAI